MDNAQDNGEKKMTLTPKQQARSMMSDVLNGLDIEDRFEDAEFMNGRKFTQKQKDEIERHFYAYSKRFGKVLG